MCFCTSDKNRAVFLRRSSRKIGKSVQEEVILKKKPPVGQKTHTGGNHFESTSSCGSKNSHRRQSLWINVLLWTQKLSWEAITLEIEKLCLIFLKTKGSVILFCCSINSDQIFRFQFLKYAQFYSVIIRCFHCHIPDLFFCWFHSKFSLPGKTLLPLQSLQEPFFSRLPDLQFP